MRTLIGLSFLLSTACRTAPFCLDADGDGYGDGAACEALDCDDTDPERFENCNGAAGQEDLDNDGVIASLDCDDANPLVSPDLIEIPYNQVDDDCDPNTPDDDLDGDRALLADDCDDTDEDRAPSLAEQCDAIDHNCDGDATKDAEDAHVFYADLDGDGFGDPLKEIWACEAPDGAVQNNEDCFDRDPMISPDADERCDPIDHNCDGDVRQDAIDRALFWLDSDGDGFGDPNVERLGCLPQADEVSVAGDCDDTSVLVSPVAVERCDSVDHNCDGDDWADAVDTHPSWPDGDKDGFGDAQADPLLVCETPINYSDEHTDCDDGTASVHPGAVERCDPVDHDCDGDPTAGADDPDNMATLYADIDQDGFGDPDRTLHACVDAPPPYYVSDSSDCDDSDPRANPDAWDISVDGPRFDSDCDGTPTPLARLDYGLCVSSTMGDDQTGDGSPSAPYKSINRALSAVINERSNGLKQSRALFIAGGYYPENIDFVAMHQQEPSFLGLSLIGGYSPDFNQNAPDAFSVTIDGQINSVTPSILGGVLLTQTGEFTEAVGGNTLLVEWVNLVIQSSGYSTSIDHTGGDLFLSNVQVKEAVDSAIRVADSSNLYLFDTVLSAPQTIIPFIDPNLQRPVGTQPVNSTLWVAQNSKLLAEETGIHWNSGDIHLVDSQIVVRGKGFFQRGIYSESGSTSLFRSEVHVYLSDSPTNPARAIFGRGNIDLVHSSVVMYGTRGMGESVVLSEPFGSDIPNITVTSLNSYLGLTQTLAPNTSYYVGAPSVLSTYFNSHIRLYNTISQAGDSGITSTYVPRHINLINGQTGLHTLPADLIVKNSSFSPQNQCLVFESDTCAPLPDVWSGNLDLAPLYRTPGDFHLQSNSPLIDAGLNLQDLLREQGDPLSNYIDTDLYRSSRGSNWDIGPSEY